ncbi:MAG: GNAT family N-acetyltransferase [Saprospiraceae bacterium]|nr:GNAT family N-acetyltransferase [Candidatus Defluviibacterium haderslevense]
MNLETTRLLLRPFNLDDAPFIIKLLNSPGWLKYIGDRNVKTIEQAEQYMLKGPLKSYQEHGYGISMVVLKSDQRSIGMCGLIKRDHLEFPDIGFAFLPEYMGQGYAYEIARATLEYGIHTLKCSPILAITVLNNDSSIKLLKKIGMQFQNNIHLPQIEEELMLFSS